ncbi:MAG: c-type cytochrome [Candidatus Korobacteraceae bacterium]
MKKSLLVMLMILAVAAFVAAQPGVPTSDVLGAHLNYGRGCAGCHAPHNGAMGNGADKSGDLTGGTSILWGQDVGALFGKTIIVGSTNGTTGYTEVLPANMAAGTPDVNGLLTCLSCHDGNYATGAMMKDQVYETLPSTYGTFNAIPTLLGGGKNSEGYLSTHPVGLNAVVGCGAPWNWDCTITNGKISMTGTNSTAFVKNYGYFVSPSAYNNTPIVVCTTCHNQHIMNVVNVTAAKSGITPGFYQTMFFMVGPYNPGSGTAGSNQTAQFCRQCHGGEANESNGNLNLPTVF